MGVAALPPSASVAAAHANISYQSLIVTTEDILSDFGCSVTETTLLPVTSSQ